ncbi:MAG: prepilin-type N-terminal cleavage/methylation domain-containing protein [bacterium]|nr:prepilin-type N-terminal cleavage/methylation domain-containing protein [bacterium]
MRIPNQQGQTIIEVLIAIIVMLTGMLGVLALAQSNVNTERFGSDRLVATQLAREAIEEIRARRDTNFISSLQMPIEEGQTEPAEVLWDDGLGIGNTMGCGELDGIGGLTFSAPTGELCPPLLLSRDPDTNVFGISGDETRFSRSVTTKPICFNTVQETESIEEGGCSISDETRIGMDITATVSWLHFGQEKNTTLVDRLYNWR